MIKSYPHVTLRALALAVSSASICASQAGTTTKSIAAFCRIHPNLDFPARATSELRRNSRGVPEEVAVVRATNWRCMNGKVYVCDGGAAGSACWRMDPSREPSQQVHQACKDNPGQSFVAMAVIGNSASTWRCEGSTPAIIKTVPLDARGFMTETWAPLFRGDGAINMKLELNADPR